VQREEKMNCNKLLFRLTLIIIIVSPLFLAIWNQSNRKQSSDPEFFVGVEYAIDNYSVEGCKELVDRVKNFTNFFVIDTVGITYDIYKLNKVCDYVYESGLYFMVFFLPLHEEYVVSTDDGEQRLHVMRYNYYPHLWVADAKETYGGKFLGAYAMDEPGGHQLDGGDDSRLVTSAETQAEAADTYVTGLHAHLNYYLYARECAGISVLTSDYGLYWFDYKAGYDTVLVEFAWNHSRPMHVGLCRGAATVQNMEWGAMLTWTYVDKEPYLVEGPELYEDLVVAYHNGAKYAVIFDHPDTDYSDYGILAEKYGHFTALEDFWDYVNSNTDKHGTEKSDVAYVLPENFGFGFRDYGDKIWGLWSADSDERTEKIWSDVNVLLEEYGFRLDIVYSDPEFENSLQQHYDKIFFWNQTIP